MARNSELILCSNIRLDRAYSNVIDYSESDMLSLCRTNKIAGDNNYSFIRNESRLVTSIPYGTALQGNYIAFQNPDYSNKWFFGFVDDVKYVNDNSTEIYYTIDQFSTWFRDLSLNDCFVIREHTNDDTIGKNTIPESIDAGEMISESETIDSSFSNMCLVIESDFNPYTQKEFSLFHMQNGSFFGSGLYLFRFNLADLDTPATTSRTNIANAMLFMSDVITQKTADFIKGMYVVPEAVLDLSNISSTTVPAHSGLAQYSFETFVSPTGTSESFDINIAKKTSFSDYSGLKNNKLLCYPYNYLFVSNNAGNFGIYKYEDFTDTSNATFKFYGSLQIGASGRLIPQNYRTMLSAQGNNVDESLPLGKYPTFEWSSDAFTNWLTQNAVNITSSVAMGVAGIGASALTGGLSAPVSGAVATGAGMSASQNILSLVGSFVQAKLLPNIEGGQNTGDVNYSTNLNGFTFKCMRPKLEYLKILDDYFSAYGYKTNRMKVPNITGRTYWNYVEIAQSDSIGHGSIPADALSTINDAFHSGVTIWHNHANIGNYELSNTIVTP